MYIRCLYIDLMRDEWNPDKNEWLKRERNVEEQELLEAYEQEKLKITAPSRQEIARIKNARELITGY